MWSSNNISYQNPDNSASPEQSHWLPPLGVTLMQMTDLYEGYKGMLISIWLRKNLKVYSISRAPYGVGQGYNWTSITLALHLLFYSALLFCFLRVWSQEHPLINTLRANPCFRANFTENPTCNTISENELSSKLPKYISVPLICLNQNILFSLGSFVIPPGKLSFSFYSFYASPYSRT